MWWWKNSITMALEENIMLVVDGVKYQITSGKFWLFFSWSVLVLYYAALRLNLVLFKVILLEVEWKMTRLDLPV